jgi:hypothetical protein
MWRCKWKNYHIITFPGLSLPKNRHTHARCFFWTQNNLEVNYSPIRISGGWGGVFLGEISSSRRYSKKDYKGKKKEQH